MPRRKKSAELTEIEPPLLCHCGKAMSLRSGTETPLMLVCSCGEYFYAANRHLTAIGTAESVAQNFEDVVLWRVLNDIQSGCYVDVGAFNPVADSISSSFYEQGWRGVLIEPVPTRAAALRSHRPNDITIEAAAGANGGTATLFVTEFAGNSTLSRSVAERMAVAGVDVSEITVRLAPLDDLLDEAGFRGRTIHFCTIDVEGSEPDVLAGFDLARWRPWILVVEATEPNRARASHDAWEKSVLDAGYRFCLFDGVNRFYVHPDKADEFAERLSYPACIFDEAFARARARLHRADELERRADELERIASQSSYPADELNEAVAELSSMRASVSWRVTRPLRSVHAAYLGGMRRRDAAGRIRGGVGSPSQLDLELALGRRIVQAAKALHPEIDVDAELDLHDGIGVLEEALASSSAAELAKAWLSLVAADGSFSDERSVDRTARILRMKGPSGVTNELLDRFSRSVEEGRATLAQLDVRFDEVIVDVTHTARARDLHTGIQRVVRETLSRWLESGYDTTLVRFDLRSPAPRPLSKRECERLKNWRNELVASDGPILDQTRGEATVSTLVPWRCHVIVPELPLEPQRIAAYRGLATGSVVQSLGVVAFDLGPIVTPETFVQGLTTGFADYLSVVKHADRIAAISRTTKEGFEAFGTIATAEGRRPPKVEAYELPTEAPTLDAAKLEAARSGLGVGAGPLVVVVGSHEPRKNHLSVLEAAERLWAKSDRKFELVFLGWSGWLGEDFDDLVEKLVSAGRPVVVRKQCSEADIWAAYRLARFTVFPSLLEGFGLPIAESLASGTPVITSNYGSMAEIAEKGGCLLVNPRNVNELEQAMTLLLDDDDALSKLRDEAATIDTRTWEDYARDLWDFFTGEGNDEPAAASRLARSGDCSE